MSKLSDNKIRPLRKLFQNLKSAIETIGKTTLRTDKAQGFTESQKQQGRANLGVGTMSTIRWLHLKSNLSVRIYQNRFICLMIAGKVTSYNIVEGKGNIEGDWLSIMHLLPNSILQIFFDIEGCNYDLYIQLYPNQKDLTAFDTFKINSGNILPILSKYQVISFHAKSTVDASKFILYKGFFIKIEEL